MAKLLAGRRRLTEDAEYDGRVAESLFYLLQALPVCNVTTSSTLDSQNVRAPGGCVGTSVEGSREAGPSLTSGLRAFEM